MTIPLKKPHLLSITIICTSLLLSPHTTYATVADGVFAYEKGNYQQARQEWLPYAALKNPNALYNLGQLSRMGRGTPQDFIKAKDYYLRAAEQGHVGAQRNLGTLYYFGRIDTVNHTKAFNWLSKAAASGDIRSQLMTGTMHFNGEATEKNNILAYAWISLSSQSGLTPAMDALDQLTLVMTPAQITQAKNLAPTLVSRHLSPDDVGLMVPQQDSDSSPAPNLNAPNLNAPNLNTDIAEDKTKNNPAAVPAPYATADNFRVQLASFSTKDAAQKALNILQGKLPDLLKGHQGHIEYADLGKKGIFYRLQLSPFTTRNTANALCRKLQDNNQNCYVVTSP